MFKGLSGVGRKMPQRGGEAQGVGGWRSDLKSEHHLFHPDSR